MLAVDVLVIGAGQAGLAAGYWLRRTGLRYVLVDGASRVGESWRKRWDSLRLFTPARYSALPGLAVPGDPDRFPTRDEIASYLEAYAQAFELPIRLGHAVKRLERVDGLFEATLASSARIVADSVIVATGAFQLPAVPGMARGLSPSVLQLTPNSYRHPRALSGGTALIVGDGATGRQIALDLAGTHRVLLATGRPRRVVPDRVLGRSLFWWLDRLGLLWMRRDSRIGRFLRERDPFPGHLRLGGLRKSAVVIKPRVHTVDGDRVTFADGTSEAINVVVWATGYRDDSSWMSVERALDDTGRVIESEGLSPVEGLYYVGRSWQRNRSSALIVGVGADSRLIVDLAAKRSSEVGSIQAWSGIQPDLTAAATIRNS